MNGTRPVVVVGYHAAELLDIACVVSALTLANHLAGHAVYRPRLASLGAAPITTATGLVVNAEVALERVRGPVDTVIVSGGIGYVDAMSDARLVAHVRRLGQEARRVASVCTGAGVLAATGLLDGRRATTHWDHAAYLEGRYPRVQWDTDRIFVTDDPLWTSAGVTAALDMTLAFVEADAGAEVARDVARQLVTYLQRPGNQAQMSMFTAPRAPRHSLVRDVVDHVTTHLDGDLSTPTLARRVGVSERHLSRLFLRELRTTPARFVRRARTEAAAQLLVTTDLTVETVAARTGFGTVESLRQAFSARYGVAPAHYRATQTGTTQAQATGASAG